VKLNKRIAAAALSVLAVGSATAADTSIFAGISAASHSTFGYLGGVKAMNNDLSKNGVLLRGLVYYGEYEYDTTAVAQGKVDGKATGAELGAGYQWVSPSNRFSLYASVDHQDHHLSPNDTRNSVRGADTGVAIQAEAETLGTPWYGGFIGKYSTANDSYWVRGRLGYVFGNMAIGPEAILAGNKEYDENRLGLFLNSAVSKATTLSFSAGGRKAEGNHSLKSQKSAYAGVSITTNF
jgi:Cellulose biosynthesis protein BcsS